MAKARNEYLPLLRRDCETLRDIAKKSRDLGGAALEAVMDFYLDGAPADKIAEYIPSDAGALEFVLPLLLRGIADGRAAYVEKCESARASAGARWSKGEVRTHTNGCERIRTDANGCERMITHTSALHIEKEIKQNNTEKKQNNTENDTDTPHTGARDAHAPAKGQAVPLGQALPNIGDIDLSDDSWLDRVETAPGQVALEVIGEVGNERSKSAMTNFQLRKDGAAFRDCIRAFISELRQGEEPRNRGAALMARLKALPDRDTAPGDGA